MAHVQAFTPIDPLSEVVKLPRKDKAVKEKSNRSNSSRRRDEREPDEMELESVRMESTHRGASQGRTDKAKEKL